jgi:hypothetical protein
MRSKVLGFVAVVALTASCGGGDTDANGTAGTEPQQNIVEVGLTEFAFGMPAGPITGGNVVFDFTNQGQAFHEVGFASLEEGKTIEDLERALNKGGPPPWAEDLAGVPVLSPGYSTAMARDLEPGNYAFWCFLPVPGEKGYTPHAAEGMLAQFEVEDSSDAPPPEAEYTVAATDKRFEVPAIEPGDHWVELANEGTKMHEFALFSPEEGNSSKDLDRFFGSGQEGPAPAVIPGGLQSIPAGESIIVRITFEAGRRYIFQDFGNEIETEFEV